MRIIGPARITGSRRRSSANARGALCSATTRKASPSNRAKTPKLASHSCVALAKIVSNTRVRSLYEPLIRRSTSDEAVCCRNAAPSSCLSRSTSISDIAVAVLRRATFGALERFDAFLRDPLLTDVLAALERRFIAAPKTQRLKIMASYTSTPEPAGGKHQSGFIRVRFGSKADIGARPEHVRFTPKSGHWNLVAQCLLCARSRHSRLIRSPRQLTAQRTRVMTDRELWPF